MGGLTSGGAYNIIGSLQYWVGSRSDVTGLWCRSALVQCFHRFGDQEIILAEILTAEVFYRKH